MQHKNSNGGNNLLKFVTGRLRSGKTTFIHNEIKSHINAGETGITLIVPEQFSFATEKSMLKELGTALYANVSVLSFSRLADTLVKPSAFAGRELMSDSAKSAVMALALDAVKDKLRLYSKQTLDKGVIEAFLKIRSEMEQSDISSQAIREAADKIQSPILQNKLYDVALACESYDAHREQSWFDSADKLSRLYDELKTNHFFKNKLVYIDGFRGFTALQMKIIGQMLIDAKAVYISLCLDNPGTSADDELFGHTADTRRRLTALANRVGVVSTKAENESMGSKYNNFPPEIKRFNSPELAAYEMNIFDSCAPVYEEDASAITVCMSPDIYTECELAASLIKKLIRENGYRCRDIAVVARDSDVYEMPMRSALRKCGVDIFEDFRRPIAATPVIAAVLAAVSIAAEGWQTENVMRFLKTGMSALDENGINTLENYTYMWQIEGSKWLEEWEYNPLGFGVHFTEKESQELKEINGLRKTAVEPLNAFCKRTGKACSAREYAKAVYDLLTELDVPKKIRNYAEKLKAQGNIADSETQDEYWNKLMSLLDSFVAAAGQRALSAKEAHRLLSLMLNLETVGVIPEGIDEVTFGSADRIRLDSPKVVYILGANYGVFPAVKAETGPFTEKDRQILSENGIELASFGEYKMKEERMIAYSAFCAAREKLFISYKTKGADESSEPSDIVERTRELFPKHKEISYDSVPALDLIESKQTAFEALARQMPYDSELYRALRKYFDGKKEYSGKTQALDRARSGRHFEIENKETARELFGDNMVLSASRIESYYKCPFKYFCQYGMGANVKKRAEVDNLLKGTISHYVLEHLLSNYKGDSLIKLTKTERQNEVSKLVEDYLNGYMGGRKNKTERFLQNIERLALSLGDVAERIVREFCVSDFRPVEFELKIGYPDKEGLPAYTVDTRDGCSVSVKGSVDRVDTAVINGENCLRVIDYKNTGKSFELGETEFGINMQMLIYLFAIWQNSGNVFGKVTPAGVIYYRNSSAPVKLNRDADEEEIAQEKNAKASPDGFVLKRRDVIYAMDKENKKIFIPAKIEESGEIKGNVISLKELESLKKRVENKITEMARNLKDGKIDAYPYTRGNNKSVCDYCDYKAVCFLDKDTVKNKPIIRDKKVILEELDREAENNE